MGPRIPKNSQNSPFWRIFKNFEQDHARASGIDRDDSDHIPITVVDSGTLVAFLVTDPAAPGAHTTPLERAAADYPG